MPFVLESGVATALLGAAVAVVGGWFLWRRLRGAPVARSQVVEVMEDAVLVLDRRARIVDLNRAAESQGFAFGQTVPRQLSVVWLKAMHGRGRVPVRSHRVTLPGPTQEAEERTFEATVASLGRRAGGPRGVLVLRDVTEQERMRREVEAAGTALQTANTELERLANTDALTGLANRRHFLARLEDEVQRAERYGRTLSLVLLDLDRFKEINDLRGHPAGDEVLRRVAGALREVSREVDLPGRLGGEELVLLLPETDLAGGRAVAERLRAGIGALEFGAEGEASWRVTASFGVACIGGETATVDELIHEADEALYRAKATGRDRVVVAETPGGGAG